MNDADIGPPTWDGGKPGLWLCARVCSCRCEWEVLRGGGVQGSLLMKVISPEPTVVPGKPLKNSIEREGE